MGVWATLCSNTFPLSFLDFLCLSAFDSEPSSAAETQAASCKTSFWHFLAKGRKSTKLTKKLAAFCHFGQTSPWSQSAGRFEDEANDFCYWVDVSLLSQVDWSSVDALPDLGSSLEAGNAETRTISGREKVQNQKSEERRKEALEEQEARDRRKDGRLTISGITKPTRKLPGKYVGAFERNSDQRWWHSTSIAASKNAGAPRKLKKWTRNCNRFVPNSPQWTC